MTTPHMPLFYTKPEPLDPQKHATLCLEDDIPYTFTAKTNAIPLTLAEMQKAALSYPIVFSPEGTPPSPTAILGLRDDENLFVDVNGRWLPSAYIPAYARRYPFIFSRVPGQEGAEAGLVLAVDMVEGAIKTGAGGRRFFEDDGKPAEITRNALDFCGHYQSAATQTEAFGEALATANLLITHDQFVDIPGKHRVRFSGFRVIDMEKLNGLDDSAFLHWRAQGWLPGLYAQIASLGQWDRLAELLLTRLQPRER